MKRTLLAITVLCAFFGLTEIARADAYIFTSVYPGGFLTSAYGINNKGQVIGNTYFSIEADPVNFLYTNGVSTFLQVPAILRGINDSGQIVGYAYSGNGSLLYANGTYTPVSVPGSRTTTAYGINNAGQIVGTYTDSVGQHGFLDTNGVFTTFDVPGVRGFAVHGVNNAGQIVGSYYTGSDLTSHSFLYSNGVIITIDVPGVRSTSAYGINDLGQIVGTIYDNPNSPQGYIYKDGIFSTIAGPECCGLSIYGINDTGQIVGTYSTYDGFLAAPTPEPTSFLLFASGLTVLGLAMRWRRDSPKRFALT